MEKRIKQLEMHVQESPNDYQSVISLLKLKSNQIEYEMKHKHDIMYKEIEMYKKEENNEE